jgi:MraZ protein
MFTGEYNFNLDDNHRLSIPNIYKKYLEETLVIVKGFEKCLYVYNMSAWREIVDKVNNLPFTKAKNRMFSRSLNSGAYEIEIDSKGRICIGQKLIDHASLMKECVILGSGNHIEIWSKEEYDKYSAENQDVLALLGEEMDL